MRELCGSRVIQPPMKAADGIAYLTSLPAKEPIFILRGQDALAYATVLDWAQRAERHNVSEEKICGAVATAADMMEWKPRRLPD